MHCWARLNASQGADDENSFVREHERPPGICAEFFPTQTRLLSLNPCSYAVLVPIRR